LKVLWRIGWQVVLARCNPLEVRRELLVAKNLALSVAQHGRRAFVLRSQQERAVAAALDERV
jgi:hypothetical protein